MEEAAGASPLMAMQAFTADAYEIAQEEVEYAEESLKEARANSSSIATIAKRTDRRTQAVVNAASIKSQRTQLDYAFLTFGSSGAKTRVLEAAASGRLFPEEMGIECQPAPNPLDIVWRNLECTSAERSRANFAFLAVMSVIAFVFSVRPPSRTVEPALPTLVCPPLRTTSVVPNVRPSWPPTPF